MKPSCFCQDVTPSIAQTSLLQTSHTCRNARSNAKSLRKGKKAVTRTDKTVTTTSDDRGSEPDWKQRGCFRLGAKPSLSSQLILQTQVHQSPRSQRRFRRPLIKPSCFCQDVNPAIAQTSRLQKSQTCRHFRSNAKSRQQRHKH